MTGEVGKARVKVLFVLYGTFDCNSAIQALHFGNLLTDLGCEVTLCGRDDPSAIRNVGEPRFECIRYQELPRKRRQLERDHDDTLICAWTPREWVRRAVAPLVERLGVPYVVHLEDNEDYLRSSAQEMPVPERDRPQPMDLADPARYPDFLRRADGVTMITWELSEFNVGNRPQHLMRPGIDSERFRPDLPPAESRERLGLREEEFVLVYHGTMHYANQREMLSLYLAVALLRRRRVPVRLVRLGYTTKGGVDPRGFAALTDGVIELGQVPWHEIPRYLALADGFVQPGAPDDFNRFRLPSKLPEFLAMGRPVVLPQCNIGNDLTHGTNALLLEEGTAPEIADRVEELVADPRLAERLGEGAREFALQHLNWRHNAVALLDFYRLTLAAHESAGVPAVAPGRAA